MSDIKIDTFRSSVFDKTFSDEETESETIDDFSQYSEMNNLIPDKLSVSSRSVTPIFKNVPIVVSQNDNEMEEKNSRSPLLIEEKDNSEDLMVEISKKTTIKKIISKTTLVNGITKASEFEEFIVKDAHTNDAFNKNQKIKFGKEQADDFQKAMSDKITNEESLKKSHKNQENCVFENIEPIHVKNTIQGRKLSNKSSESIKSQSQNIDKFSKSNDHGKQKNLNTGDKLNEREKYVNSNDTFNERKNLKVENKFMEIKDLNTNEKFFESKKQIQDPISERNFKSSGIFTEKIIPSEKLRESIDLKNDKEKNSKTLINDNNLRNEKTSYSIDNNNDSIKRYRDKNYKDYIIDYKIRSFNDKNNFTRPYSNYNENKAKNKRSGDYNDYRDLKSITVDSKPLFNDSLNSNFKHEEKNIKWVDPFKSYHLKYDLKDNGRSMQNWIKQKQEALNRSNSKDSMKNSVNNKCLTHKSASTKKSFSIVSPIIKGYSHKDIKEFITRGNIKENLFRSRHPFPEVTEHENLFQHSYTYKEEDFKKSYGRVNSKSFESFYSNKTADEFTSDEKSNIDFPLQNSEVWNNLDLIEQYIEQTSSNVRDDNPHQDEIDTYREYCHGTLCCCSPCYSYCTGLCMPCNCLILNGNHIKTSKYISYESPNLSLVNERKTTENLNSRNSMYESSQKTFNHTNERFYSEEPEMNKQISNNREIDILENKLNTIENKIRNMKLNGPNVYDCEIDLECQRRDLEKQLDCLYMFTPSIKPRSSIKT